MSSISRDPSVTSFFQDPVRGGVNVGSLGIISRSSHVSALVVEEDGNFSELKPKSLTPRRPLLSVLVNADMFGDEFNHTPFTQKVEVLLVVITYHLYTSSFSPTMAEALAQIPEEYVDEAGNVREIVAFRTIHEFPQSYTQKKGRTYRWARTEYYRRKK